MCQMAFKQITPDDVGRPLADFSSAKIRINFKVDTFTLEKKKRSCLCQEEEDRSGYITFASGLYCVGWGTWTLFKRQHPTGRK